IIGDDTSVLTESHDFTVQTATTSNRVSLTRIKAGEVAEVELSYTLVGITQETLVMTFPAGFTVLSPFTDLPACASDAGFTESTLTADVAGCDGTLTFSGATVQNPVAPGTYIVRWTDDEGEG